MSGAKLYVGNRDPLHPAYPGIEDWLEGAWILRRKTGHARRQAGWTWWRG